jgi:hypothetical protein
LYEAAGMTRFTALLTSLALASSIAACGSKKEDASASAAKTATGEPAAAKAPTLTINEADWVDKDLSTVAPLAGITMKVPKDATLEQNGNGGVDIKIGGFYMITVSAIAVSNVAEGIKDQKSLTIEDASYQNGKVLAEEPNGFVYSMQMKTEDNGTTYQPEAHFAFFVEKDGAVWEIHDERPLDGFDLPGSAWSESLAKQVYGIVKTSAKAK